MQSGIRMGLRVEEYDEEAKILEANKGGRNKFQAGGYKSNVQKGMDQLLFGRPPPKKRQQQKKTVPAVPKKQDEKKPIVNNFVKPKEDIKPKQVIKAPQPVVVTYDDQFPQQPEQYLNIDMGDPYRMDLQVKVVYNRPVYIRKFKKIAQDFSYATENKERNIAIDVIRPKQCFKDIVIKSKVPDFVDNQFPPNDRALGKSLKGIVQQWKRIGQLCKQPVMGKYIDPNDIQAGRFSSPEFLSTLSCLAEKQSNIKRIIEDQKYNLEGFYYVRLNMNGVWRYVAIDDYVPLLAGQPAAATSFLDNQTDLWVALVQKAYAKAFMSGYQVYAKCQSHDVYLRDLTGSPAQTYPMNNPDVFDVVKAAIQRGQPVLAVGNEQSLNVGMNPNFSFNILKCDPKTGLQLRSSWGSIQEKTKLATSKEGTFSMNLQQCKQFLNHVIIARVNDDYCTSVIESKHRKGFFSSYSFRLRQNATGYISVTQMDERLIPSHVGYAYSPSRIIVEKKISDTKSIYVNSMFTNKLRNNDIEVILTPGQYIVHVITNWVGKEYDYFVSFYGSSRIDFKKVHTQNLPNMLFSSLQNECILKGKKVMKGSINEYTLYHEQSNLTLITAENSTDRAADHTVDLRSADFKTLSLVNTRNKDENFADKSANELELYRDQTNQDRRWQTRLQPHESFTWVISTSQLYKEENLKKWNIK